jgi:hypothetical protein
MSRPAQFRRAIAVLKPGSTQPMPPTLGNRSLHHYWTLLKTHFRSVFLAPQSLSDGTSTQWTWREPIDGPPLTAAELATVRKRLTVAQRSFADSIADAAESGADSGRAASVLPQLQAHLDPIIQTLVALPDAALASYLVRSEQGLLLHSWGLGVALIPSYPDTTECEITGTVFVANAPAPDREVLLEKPEGEDVDRTRSDAVGRFRFSKISPGHYRARAVSGRDTFPDEGVFIEIDHTSITGVELRDHAPKRGAAVVNSMPKRRRIGVAIFIFAVATVIAVVNRHRPPEATPMRATEKPTAHANATPDTFGPGSVQPADESSFLPANTVAAAKDPTPRPTPSDRRPHESTPRPIAVIEQRVVGRPLEQSGVPFTETQPPASASSTAGKSASGRNSASGGGAGASSNATAGTASPASSFAGARPSASRPATGATAPAPAITANAQPTPNQNKPPTPKAFPSAPTPTPSLPTESSQPAPTANAEPVFSNTSPATTALTQTPPASSPPNPEPDQSQPIIASDAASENPSADTPVSPDSSSTSTRAGPTSEAPANPSAANAQAVTVAIDLSVASTAGDSRRVRFRASPWQTRLLQDSILPTAPTRIGDDDAIEVLRERRYRERRAQTPFFFKQPRTRIGFVIELRDDNSEVPPHWHETTKTPTAQATIAADRAEISWSGSPPAGAECTLLAADGSALARVTTDERGTLTLIAAAGLRAWPWIGIERPETDDQRLSPAEWTTRLEWRVLSGAPSAPTWLRDDQWLNRRGHRLDLQPGDRSAGPATRALALVDRITGWAIVTEIEQFQEMPAAPISLSR